MKVYTKIELVWDGEKYVESASESYEYKGEVAHAKGGGSEETVQETKPWAEQQPYLTDLFNQAQDYNQQAPSDTSASTGIVGQGIDAYTGAASSVSPYLQAIQDANQGYATGSLLSPGSNPALQQYIDLSNQSISRNFTENVNPAIEGGAAQSGNIGSSRQGIAQGLAAGRNSDAIAQSTAGLTNAAYAQGLTATMQAQSMAPGIASAQSIPGDMFTQAGALQYGLDTQADNAQLSRLQDYQALISGNYGGTATSTGPAQTSAGLGTAVGAGVGLFYGGAAGGTAGAAIGSYFD